MQLFIDVKASKPAPKVFKPERFLSQEDQFAVSESSAVEPSSGFLPKFPTRMETDRKGPKMGLGFF